MYYERNRNMSKKEDWNLETALKVLQHPTVDAQLWAEAVEWLLKYGPESIRKVLLEASNTATEIQFPEVEPAYYTEEGQPVYDIPALSEILGMPEEEIRRIIDSKGVATAFDEEDEPADPFDNMSQTVH